MRKTDRRIQYVMLLAGIVLGGMSVAKENPFLGSS